MLGGAPVVFAGGVTAAVTSPADRGMVTDCGTVQTDTARELSTELLGPVCVTKNGVHVDVDVASPDVSPAVFAGTAAVPVSLPAITGVVYSAVYWGGSWLMRCPSGPGGMRLYQCWNRGRETTSIWSSDRVTPLRISCRSWTYVLGVGHLSVPGGLWAYTCCSRKRETTSILLGDRVVPLCACCQ